jgi:hypothetical protein
VADLDTPTALLHLQTWLDRELHESFSTWCDHHHRGLLTVPGFRRARRFEFLDGSTDDEPQFLTMYEVDSLAVFTSDPYLEHGRTAGGLPDFLRGRLRVERHDCSILDALPHEWWPPAHSTHLSVFRFSDDRIAAVLHEQLPTTIDSSVPVVIRVVDSVDDTPLVLIDHGEAELASIESIARATGASRSQWRCVFDESSS